MSSPGRPLEGRRILVLEDEYMIAMLAKRWLEVDGAVVVGPAPTVKRALALLEDEDIDAALLDVNLGNGATGYPLADRLEALGLPFAFATGDVERTGPAVHQGRPRLIKPYTERDVTKAVLSLLSP